LDALSRTIFRETKSEEVQVSATNRIRSAAEIDKFNLGSQTQGECPIKAPDILRQPVMLLHVAKQKAVLSPRKL
jgi:hypothetical protein